MEEGLLYHHRLNAKDIPSDILEVYRYLGFPKPVAMASVYEESEIVPKETVDLVKNCVFQMHEVLRPQALFQMFSLNTEFAEKLLESKDLAKRLENCSHVLLLAATIGPQVDAMVRRWTKLDTAKAAVAQSCGAMFMESYMDILVTQIEEQAKESNFLLKPRYSAGYGDLPLDVQRLVFSVLPCTQKIGLTLTEYNLMLPEKSVTAFIGIETNEPA